MSFISFYSSFLLSLFGYLSFQFFLDLFSLLHIHLLRFILIQSHILQQLLSLLFLPLLLSHFLPFFLLGLMLLLDALEIVVIAFLDGFVILARHQQYYYIHKGMVYKVRKDEG